jgi:hypothetical protein
LSPKKTELLLSVLIVLFLSWIVWEARNWPAPSKLFPWSLGFTVLVLALVQLGAAWRAALQESRARISMPAEATLEQDAVNQARISGSAEGSAGLPGETNVSADATFAGTSDAIRRRALTICAWIVVFFLVIWLTGFKAGSLLLTFTFMKFTANEKWWISAAIAVGTCLFFWLVFDIALRIPLDNGVLADYFRLH